MPVLEWKEPSMTDPNSVTPPARNNLASAAWRGSMGSIRHYLTIPQFAQTIEKPSEGRTPLLWAISAGRSDATVLLLQAGADITKKTADGDSALACAVWGGNARLVKRMLDKGFDPLEKNIHGKSALDWAHEGGKADIMELLTTPVLAALHARTVARQQRLKSLAPRRKITLRP
jgi:ankyrin repeat protein